MYLDPKYYNGTRRQLTAKFSRTTRFLFRTCMVRNPETMPQSPKKIQVLNVPGNVPVQRLLHKLTIYFQKSSNGGGEVLDVEYPTSVKDCAYVIFEKEE
eukprot:g22298.t1